MPLYKFDQNDVYHNRVGTHPQCNFFIYSGSVYYNNRPQLSGAFTSSVPSVPPGYVSLYEINVDRVSGSVPAGFTSPDIAYSFINTNRSYTDYRRPHYILDSDDRLIHAVDHPDVIVITGSYPMSASISKEYFKRNHSDATYWSIIRAINVGSPDLPIGDPTSGEQIIRTVDPLDPHGQENWENYGISRKTNLGSKISALKNTLDSYSTLSHHYLYSSASLAATSSQHPAANQFVTWDKGRQEIGLVSIPSIFFGREIQKGSVSLKFYISGTLIGELHDKNRNGELIQVGPTGSVNSGSTAGVVLYNEGFMLLTGSWDLTANPVAATAELNFKKLPANNDTITLLNSAGVEKIFKFNTGNSTVDGTLNSDGISVNVGIAGSPANGGANRFKNAVDNADFDITATRSGRLVTLTQDTKGVSGNTGITISCPSVTGPSPSEFSNGMDGAFSPPHTELYGVDVKATEPRWIDFAQTIATGSSAAADMSMPSSSFELNFKGTTHIPTITMLAHARKGHLNFSNNSTYIKHGQETTPMTSSTQFKEQKSLKIKNTVSSSYQNFTASYKRQTYISKIGIYDDKRNLIGIAKVATPVKKTEERDFTFKLKLDF